MNEGLLTFIESNRSTMSSYHLFVGIEWRKFGEIKKLHSPLLYSAFEFRCSIERFLFEFYYVITHHEGFTQKEENIANNFSKLIKEIYTIAGGKKVFSKKLIFNNLVARNDGFSNKKIAVFDINQLNKYWLKLSEYCHKQLEPKKTWDSLGNKWIVDGYELLNEVEKKLWDLIVLSNKGWLTDINLSDEIKTAREDFINDKIDESTLKIRLDLIKPILKRRDSIKKSFQI